MGEVYAIALAKTLGITALVTDDIKQGGPYMSLLQFDDDVMPLNFADIMILQFLSGEKSAEDILSRFEKVNRVNGLEWSFSSHLKRFIRRFWHDPYREAEKRWIKEYCETAGTDFCLKVTEVHQMVMRTR